MCCRSPLCPTKGWLCKWRQLSVSVELLSKEQPSQELQDLSFQSWANSGRIVKKSRALEVLDWFRRNLRQVKYKKTCGDHTVGLVCLSSGAAGRARPLCCQQSESPNLKSKGWARWRSIAHEIRGSKATHIISPTHNANQCSPAGSRKWTSVAKHATPWPAMTPKQFKASCHLWALWHEVRAATKPGNIYRMTQLSPDLRHVAPSKHDGEHRRLGVHITFQYAALQTSNKGLCVLPSFIWHHMVLSRRIRVAGVEVVDTSTTFLYWHHWRVYKASQIENWPCASSQHTGL